MKKGCGCTGGPAPTVMSAARSGGADGSEAMSKLRLSRGLMLEVSDADLVMIEFDPPDAGDKTRYGLHDFGQGNVMVYGRFDKGAQFYAHRKDVEADLAVSRSQRRQPIFNIIGPTRDEIAEEHEVEELAPPTEVAEVEWLKPIVVEPVAKLHDVTEILAPDPLLSDPLFFAEAKVEDRPAIDADNYFPPVSDSPGRLTNLVDLDLEGIKNPDRFIAILNESKIHTAWDVVLYERKYAPKGLSRLDGIGPKARRVFVDAARKVV